MAATLCGGTMTPWHHPRLCLLFSALFGGLVGYLCG